MHEKKVLIYKTKARKNLGREKFGAKWCEKGRWGQVGE